MNYKIAIPDMFTFGRFFPEIFRDRKKGIYFTRLYAASFGVENPRIRKTNGRLRHAIPSIPHSVYHEEWKGAIGFD